ncbi:MAG: hydratase [Pseudomonadota bacterium]|nr:hydratase [Pseudomonadota bacterium]
MKVDGLCSDLLAAYDGATRLPLPTEREPAFCIGDAYVVADQIRRRRIARGERQLGYKIGFTNRGIWARYGVHAPIWGPVWDSTVTQMDGTAHTASLTGLVQPRLEPEIMFGFNAAPSPGMSTAQLAACIDWVAHGFEIVHTHFDSWRFQAPDTVADFALHGRLLVGPRTALQRFASAPHELAALQLQLHRDGVSVDAGDGHVVLDGPLEALRTWVDAMHAQPQHWPIGAGDIVSTGTLTDAWPLAAGERWQTLLSDARLPGLTLRIEA